MFKFSQNWQELLAVAAILLLAAFFRLYLLDQIPPGLHYDEAFNATEAQKVLSGVERPLYFRGDLTEEPMAIYTTALAFSLFGASPWSLRVVSALAGILTVAALYLLARVIFQSRNQAALAALVLALLYWHINFSRLGMEPIFLPLVLTLCLVFLWRALRQNSVTPGPDKRWRGFSNYILAGVFLGAAQYTYKAALFVPLLIVAFLGLELLLGRDFRMRHWRGLLIFIFVAVLVFAPLGLYFVAHPGEFLERPSTVTVASADAPTLFESAIRVAGMFFVHGDENPRSNLPGRPALDPFLALGFIAGLIACVLTIRRRESRFLLLWLAVTVLPSVLTDFSAHFGRSIGATPAIALVVAWGFGWLGRIRAPRYALGAILVLGLISSGYASFHDYFDIWGARTGLYDSFDAGYLALATKLRQQPANEVIYISPVDQANYTIQFGLGGRDAHSFDGRRALVLPPPGVDAAYGIVTREDNRSLARLGKLFPQARVVDTVFDLTGMAYAKILQTQGSPPVAPQQFVHARFGEAIELIGYDLVRDSNDFHLTLYWGSIAEVSDDYTVFVHLAGAMNPATQSPVWAQDDTQPGRGSYPTGRWQAGEVIMDDYRLTWPESLPRGEYEIEIGMYILKTGVRIAVSDANGAPMENDRVLLKRVSLP